MNKNEKHSHFGLDFILVLAVSLILYLILSFIGSPFWLTICVLVIWGTITGFKPTITRKLFGFLYPKE